MEHFKLDSLEKTILALAFKMGSRPDLKTKGTPFRMKGFFGMKILQALGSARC
jgi:hypothetical protein